MNERFNGRTLAQGRKLAFKSLSSRISAGSRFCFSAFLRFFGFAFLRIRALKHKRSRDKGHERKGNQGTYHEDRD